MTKVFISYRRSDATGHAGRIATALRAHPAHPQVFFDTSDIGPGQTWPDALKKALDDCTVMLVVIGKTWTQPLPGQARSRLFDPEDVVAREIRIGLARKDVKLVPVRVGGAPRLAESDLPPDLAPLLLRQDRELHDESFDDDLAALAKRFLSVRRWRVYATMAAAGLALVAGAWWLRPEPPPEPAPKAAALPIDADVELLFKPLPKLDKVKHRSLRLLEEKPVARSAVLFEPVQREGGKAFVFRNLPLPAPGQSFWGLLTRGDIEQSQEIDPEIVGAVQTPVCFDVLADAKPPTEPVVFECREKEGCFPVKPPIVRACRGSPGSLAPAGWSWIGTAHAQPAASDRPQAGDWIVPTLEALRQRRGTERARGYSEITISGQLPAAAARADAIAIDVRVNGHRLWPDGLPGRAFAQGFDPTRSLALAFGLENLNASGEHGGLEQLQVTVHYLRERVPLHVEELRIDDFSALRSIAGVARRTQGPDLAWSATYYPAPADQYQIFAYGSSSQADNERVRRLITGAGAVGPPSLERGAVVGVLRSPVAAGAAWGVALGVRQPSGQVRLSYDEPAAADLCRQLSAEPGLRAVGLNAATFDVRVIAEAVGDKRGKRRIPCAEFGKR